MFGTRFFILVLRWALLEETSQFYNYTNRYPHTHPSYYQVWYVEWNWSELIFVVTASGGYNWLWISNTSSEKKKQFYFGSEVEGSSSLQRTFTWSTLKKSCYWIINHLKCNFPFFLTFKLPCLTSAGYPRSSRFSKRTNFRFFGSWATFLLLLNFIGSRS